MHHHHRFTTVKTTNRIYHLQGKHHRRGKYPLIETRRVNGKQIDSITANNILISWTRRRWGGREKKDRGSVLVISFLSRHRVVAGCSVTFRGPSASDDGWAAILIFIDQTINLLWEKILDIPLLLGIDASPKSKLEVFSSLFSTTVDALSALFFFFLFWVFIVFFFFLLKIQKRDVSIFCNGSRVTNVGTWASHLFARNSN